MIYKVFAVKDKALDSFSAPFTQATIEAGMRMWRDLVMFGDENNKYRRSPEDFTLYFIGEYDDTTAKMESTTLFSIVTAAEVLIEAKPKGE